MHIEKRQERRQQKKLSPYSSNKKFFMGGIHSSPPLQEPAPPQSITFCTDKYAEGQTPPLTMLLLSARALVEPIAQQEPLQDEFFLRLHVEHLVSSEEVRHIHSSAYQY